MTAEAALVCFYADIRLHHGSAEYQLQLIFLEHIKDKAEGTVIFLARQRVAEAVVYRYGINLFSHVFSPFQDYQKLRTVL